MLCRSDATPHAAATSAAVGEHLLLDLYGVAPALLRDAQALEAALREAAAALGATIPHAPLHPSDPLRLGAPAGAQGRVPGVLPPAASPRTEQRRAGTGRGTISSAF